MSAMAAGLYAGNGTLHPPTNERNCGAGQLIVGDALSILLMVNEQVAVEPALSFAVSVTVVEPIPDMIVPDTGD